MRIPVEYQQAQDDNLETMVVGLYSHYAQFSMGYKIMDGIKKKPSLSDVLITDHDATESAGLVRMGVQYPNIEQAYIAERFISPNIRQRIARQESPGRARRIAEGYKPDNPNFDPIVSLYSIYEQRLSESFLLLQFLKLTSPKPIIHLNWWGDLLLGAKLDGDEIVGDNNLGKILEVLREKL